MKLTSYMKLTVAPTDDLIAFWRSKVTGQGHWFKYVVTKSSLSTLRHQISFSS